MPRSLQEFFGADETPSAADEDFEHGELFAGERDVAAARAEEIFEQVTRALAHPGASADELAELRGWTLHQLRHSAVTHGAEAGTNTPTLLARDRLRSSRTSPAATRPHMV